jgi:hypothetical protein
MSKTVKPQRLLTQAINSPILAFSKNWTIALSWQRILIALAVFRTSVNPVPLDFISKAESVWQHAQLDTLMQEETAILVIQVARIALEILTTVSPVLRLSFSRIIAV